MPYGDFPPYFHKLLGIPHKNSLYRTYLKFPITPSLLLLNKCLIELYTPTPPYTISALCITLLFIPGRIL